MKKAIQNGVSQEMFVVSSHLCLKFGANMQEIEWLKKENTQVDHERYESIWIENSKQQEMYNKTNEKQMDQNRSQYL